MTSSEPEAGSRPWFWTVVAMLPFAIPYVAHYLHRDLVPTGFIAPDMPYYLANGRAIFERGNGLAYPNPYDPDPQAPAIYFHWYVWILGVGVMFQLDPGMWFIATGVVAGLIWTRLTYALVARLLPDARFRTFLFLFAMWGGGLLTLGAVVDNAIHQSRGETVEPLIHLDPFLGEWSLYWGRLLCFPTESLYHALVTATWICMLSGRRTAAIVCAGALAATHPFSGAENLAVLGAWWWLRLFFSRERSTVAFWKEGILIGFVAALFFGYNVGFLELFPAHQTMRKQWTLAWTVDPLPQWLAYGPVLLVALFRTAIELWRTRRLAREACFLWTAAWVAFLLSNHQWFMEPRQPLHFTRGYVWMPLFLISLPFLQAGLKATIGLMSSILQAVSLTVLLAAASADNVTYIASRVSEAEKVSILLPPAKYDMLRWIARNQPRGVLLCPDAELSYLISTYAPTRTYCGHPHNTPDYARRRYEDLPKLLTGRIPLDSFYDVDLVLIETDRNIPGFHPGDWKVRGGTELYRNEKWVLLERPIVPEHLR